MFRVIKKAILKWARKTMLKNIEALDKYEDDLFELIVNYTDSHQIVSTINSFIIVQLKRVVKKSVGWFKKLLGGNLVETAIESIFSQIDLLKEYEDDIVILVENGIGDRKKLSKEAIDFVQELLRDIVKRNIKI